MQKSLAVIFIHLLSAGIVLAGHAPAQQNPAAASSQSTSSSTASGQSASPSTPAAPKTQAGSAAKRAPAATTLTLKTQKDKESYAMGMNLAMGLRRQDVTLDPALVARGMKDALAGGKTLLTEDEVRATLQQLQSEIRQRVEVRAHEAGATNRKEGETFLATNKTKEGVVALPSGLQYKIMAAGTGPKPTASDTVTCNYRGTLINGTEFDSSYKRGQPASFPVGGVIKGWTEALQLMPVGSKWQLFIPADLAYADSSPSRDIPPGSTLIFEVELLSIGEPKK